MSISDALESVFNLNIKPNNIEALGREWRLANIYTIQVDNVLFRNLDKLKKIYKGYFH